MLYLSPEYIIYIYICICTVLESRIYIFLCFGAVHEYRIYSIYALELYLSPEYIIYICWCCTWVQNIYSIYVFVLYLSKEYIYWWCTWLLNVLLSTSHKYTLGAVREYRMSSEQETRLTNVVRIFAFTEEFSCKPPTLFMILITLLGIPPQLSSWSWSPY